MKLENHIIITELNILDVFRTSISRLSYYIKRIIFCLKNLVSVSKRTFKQQIILRMVFIKYNSLKSDIFLNPIFILCFSGSRFFRFQIFQGPGFSLIDNIKVNKSYGLVLMRLLNFILRKDDKT